MNTTILKPLISGRQIIVKAIAIASVAIMVFLAGCSARRGTSATIEVEEGVVINGVRWATRNADGFRTFVALPEMLGGFYASNMNRARDRYTLRRSTFQRGGSRSNNWIPCPPGWRLPTAAEFESLIAAGSVWTVVNGVPGRIFGTEPNQIFLPAAGEFVDEAIYVNEIGSYWVAERVVMFNFTQGLATIGWIRGVPTQQLNPRITGQRAISSEGRFAPPLEGFSPLITVNIPPELSVRCVAVTTDAINY